MNSATHHSQLAKEGMTGPAFTAPAAETRVTDPAIVCAATLAALEKKGRAPYSPASATLEEKEGQGAPPFVSLDRETRAAVDTATAAYHLNRQPQTLRCWAAFESGPLRPLRVNGRLAWKTDDLRRLLGVSA